MTNVHEQSIELLPDPTRMIEGLRDTGYEFDTAVADILDNSIAAGATVIQVKIDMDFRGNISFLIADNGAGMDKEGLFNAMRYGAARRPNPASLGKYGLGLKTASTAFCRRLSVISRPKEGEPTLMATWDLDHVKAVGKWELLTSDQPEEMALKILDQVTEGKAGTVVLWQKTDRLMKDYADPKGGHARRGLEKKIDALREHLAMVYQRFLDGNDTRVANHVSITLNGKPLHAWDPFVKEESELVAEETIPVEMPNGVEAKFTVKAYILPRREEFSTTAKAKEAQLSSDKQGIYVYRENRLIRDADWLGIYQKEPHGTLLRVEFSFDHTLDEAFHLDIRKSQIILNDKLWDWLKDSFLPAPRREADRRYRDGEQKKITKQSENAHATSNNTIREQESTATNTTVKVVDAATGECLVQNAQGEIRLKLPVISAIKPGELFVQPVETVTNGLLYEPVMINGHKGIRLNTSHPYYHKVYMPNLSRSVTVQGMDSLLWALGMAELSAARQDTVSHFKDLRFELSRILGTLVDNLPDPVVETANAA